MDSPTSVKRFDPIGGVLFGRDASLPAMVLLMFGFFFLNYQQNQENKLAAEELKNEESSLARIRQARNERKHEMDAATRLDFKRKQLQYFRDEQESDARRRGRETMSPIQRQSTTKLNDRIVRLTQEVADLEVELQLRPK